MALPGTEQLRKQWNNGACEAAYNGASASFRSQSLLDWLSQCEHLREKLGVWQSFVSQEATTCGGSVRSTVCLDGVALFGGNRYDVIIGWIVENRQPRLFYLSLAQNEKAIETMPPPSQHLLDPPLLSTPVKCG